MADIHIKLHGFSDQDVKELRSFLVSNNAIADVNEVHAIHANGVQEMLSAALTDTTLVAQILKEVGGAIVSVSAIAQAVRSWLGKRTKVESQHAEVSISE